MKDANRVPCMNTGRRKPNRLGQGGDMHFAYAFAAQASEVEVDTQNRRGTRFACDRCE